MASAESTEAIANGPGAIENATEAAPWGHPRGHGPRALHEANYPPPPPRFEGPPPPPPHMRHEGPGEPGGPGVTPYGDFCSKCSRYGIGSHPVSRASAIEALQFYFAGRGLEARNFKGGPRFMRADIFSREKLVDRILFDRVTGRVRSIY